MRRPTVLMILHPPSAVPRVSPSAQASVDQVGAESELISPEPSRSAATTPTAFCASLAPWLKASADDIAHCPAVTDPRQARVARRSSHLRVRITASAANPPSTGEIARAIRVPNTPTG